MSRLNKNISEIIIYICKTRGEIQICLFADGRICIDYAYKLFDLSSMDELLQVLAKFRVMEKTIRWYFGIDQHFLKNTELLKFMENIQNGDSLRANYSDDVHDNFIYLIETVRQFRLEKIYIIFHDKILMDIVEFVSAATRANIYYTISKSYNKLDFFKF